MMILLRTERLLTEIDCFIRHAEDWKAYCFSPSSGKISSAIGFDFQGSQAEADRLNLVGRFCDGY